MLVELQLGLEKQFGIVIRRWSWMDMHDCWPEARATHRRSHRHRAGAGPTPTAAQPVADPAHESFLLNLQLVAALGRLWKMILIERRNAP